MMLGVTLLGLNGSGDLFISNTTEEVHFQNGQYLSYVDIGAYVKGA